jgi:hypothetical protein
MFYQFRHLLHQQVLLRVPGEGCVDGVNRRNVRVMPEMGKADSFVMSSTYKRMN